MQDPNTVPTAPAPTRVVVTDVDISFGQMLGLAFKAACALLIVGVVIGVPLYLIQFVLAVVLTNPTR